MFPITSQGGESPNKLFELSLRLNRSVLKVPNDRPCVAGTAGQFPWV